MILIFAQISPFYQSLLLYLKWRISFCTNIFEEKLPLCIIEESLLIEEADRQPPHKIDENMWKNREHMEEIIFLLERSHWPATVRYVTCLHTHTAILLHCGAFANVKISCLFCSAATTVVRSWGCWISQCLREAKWEIWKDFKHIEVFPSCKFWPHI